MVASLYAAESTSVVTSVIPVIGLSFVKLSYCAIKVTTRVIKQATLEKFQTTSAGSIVQ